MCGIAGILGATSDADRAPIVRQMMDAQEHRGPDDQGVWTSTEAHCALGHRRLAIIDLSATGQQPMESRDGRWVLTFNGEIYGHRGLRQALESGGVPFRGTSDTEVLLEGIARWGFTEALQRVNGMFAVAAFDRKERRLHLARDPLGEKPLHWAEIDGGIVFASELDALRRCPAVSSAIDRASAASFFRLGYIPAPHTIHVGVQKLSAGHRLEARLGERPTVRPYWDPVDELLCQERLPEEEAYGELTSVLTDSVRLRLDADVPVGVFLSSGVDSACIAALAAEVSDHVRTFTVGFDEPTVDESSHAAAIASHLGTEHQTLTVSADAGLALVDDLGAIHGEPFADPSAIPMLLLSAAAREHVKVCLSGDGGDEVFGGYNRYLLGARSWPGLSRVPHRLRRGAAHVVERLDPDLVDRFLASDVVPASLRVRNAGDKLERLAALLRTHDDADLAHRLVSVWPEGLPLDASPHRTMIDDPPAALRSHDPVEQLMFLDTVTTLPDQMLTKVDRASMRSSLEVRVPLLDPKVVRAAWRSPPTLRLAEGVSKRALRRILADRVPSSLLEGPKIGFDPPLGQWLRGPLRPWAEDLLSEAALRRSDLDAAVVRPLWRSYLDGHRAHYRVWSLLVYQSWQQHVRRPSEGQRR